MTNVNISLKEEAYKFLVSLKKENKSFSDVVLEFKKEKGSKENIMNFFGVLEDVDWGLREKNMREFREGFEKRMRLRNLRFPNKLEKRMRVRNLRFPNKLEKRMRR